MRSAGHLEAVGELRGVIPTPLLVAGFHVHVVHVGLTEQPLLLLLRGWSRAKLTARLTGKAKTKRRLQPVRSVFRLKDVISKTLLVL